MISPSIPLPHRGRGQGEGARSAEGPRPCNPRYPQCRFPSRPFVYSLHADKLRADGRVVRGANGKMTVTDGPFAESKEILGGFWIVEATSYEQIQRDLANHPHLAAGSLEVREIDDMSARG